MAKRNDLWCDPNGNSWFPVVQIDDAKLKAAVEAFQKANAEAKARREAVEKLMLPKLAAATPDGHEPIVSYRFGKMSVAYRPKGSAKASGGKVQAGITL